jgi:amino acid adenylation domain-containing protein
VLELVPIVIQALLEEGRGGPLPTLRRLLSTGEALSPQLARRWLSSYPDMLLFNAYGPAECSDDVTMALVQPPSVEGRQVTPIGRPMGNLRLYVLDAWGGLVPRGSIGELYVGGVGVGRGYLQDPGRTAEVFVPDPFAQEPGQRLYKTGDRGRYRADGQLEYLGRSDQQVKVRGVRIELGEIEAVLREYAGVKEAVVLLRQEERGDASLIGYVQMHSGKQLKRRELRTFVQGRLPTAMVPRQLVCVTEFPLLSNGKVDRHQLVQVPLEPDGDKRVGPGKARTPLEELLIGLWEELLGRKQLGRQANFFEQGGHSLLATQLLARVRRMLGVEVPLRALFEEPTVEAFAVRVEQALSRQDGDVLPPLQLAARSADLPLSYAQQRLWFLDQLEPGNTVYLLAEALHLEGEVQERSLERALAEVIRRHESLRTTFAWRDEQPVQVIHPPQPFLLPVIDLRALAAEQAWQQAHRLSEQEGKCPCDLVQGPLLRTALLRVGPGSRVFLLTLHHSITDGWSNEILLQEISLLYQADVQGQPSPLAPLAFQYADYALWQRGWLQGKTLERQLVYWQTQLAGVPALELPTDYPRPAVQSSRGASLPVQLSTALLEGLVALSGREQVTVFMLLLASFQVVLQRWSGQSDLSVGTPIANRRQEQTEDIIGFFVNTLVLRTDGSGNPSFVQLLQRVRQVCLEAYAHQDVPFEKIVEVLAPERDLSRSPLFQVMFALQNVPSGQIDLPGVTAQMLVDGNGSSQFELTLALEEREEGIQGSLEYNADLFTAETISRLLGHWQTLLEGVVLAPHALISELPLLSEEERRCLLVEWNTTQVALPRQGCLQDLFEQQVQRTPDAIALVDEEQQLTYAQFNRRANQLAHHLRKRGIGPDALVGICLERSLDLVIGVLGVLKAGGAYVPLDPGYPQERLAFMLADARIQVLVTQQRLLEILPPHHNVVCLDTDWHLIAQESKDNRSLAITSESLLYVLYTSGSTGQPKGVMGTHGSTLNRLHWMWTTYPFHPEERCCQKTALSFVDSVWEIFGPLLKGVRTHIIPESIVKDPPSLLHTLATHAVTRIVLVPSLLRALMETADNFNGMLPDLKYCVSSGEALPLDLAQRFLHAVPHCTLLNLYGSSEVAADVTCYAVRQEHEWRSSIPIGRPIANTQIYLLDRVGNPVPIGVIGEVYIAGIGLARGYSGRADLTGERFVPNPFAEQEGERLYRTGDLARYRSDGAIEYVGRRDQQVKVRGFRIELGEIEAVLQASPAIREAVVLLRGERVADKRLVAYVVGQPGEHLEHRELRRALQRQVPAYMIPSAFVVLEAFPLLPNGKVDRRALKALEVVEDEKPDVQQGAGTPIEELLEALWSEILERQQIRRHDNFFEQGGHSLLATQLVAQVRNRLGVEVPLRALFEAPTVSEFALQVEQALRADAGSELLPMTVVSRSSVLPLSYVQQRLWFLDQLEPGSIAYLHANAFHLEGTVDVCSLEGALQVVIGRHEILRTTFAEQDGQPVQIIHEPPPFLLPVIDLRELDAEHAQQQAHLLTRQERQHPCDLAKGPLLRATLLRLEPASQIFLLTLHQIITDSKSNQILLHEVSMLYQTFLAEQSLQLELPPFQYVDYAVWQQQWLQGEVLDSLLNYWTKQLRGVRALELPTRRLEMAEVGNQRAIRTFKLSSSIYQKLIALSHQEGVTLFMTTLAAFQILLHHYTGRQDITVGTKIANRRHPETENMPGIFENMLALRIQLSDQETFQEMLKRVRVTVLHAYAYRDLPFEKSLEALKLEKHEHQLPLLNVLFDLKSGKSVPQQSLELPGVIVNPVNAHISMGQFDVAMFLAEEAEHLIGHVNYCTCMLHSDDVEHLTRLFEALLQNIVTRPDATIEQLEDMIDEGKHRKIVEEEKREEDTIRKLKSAKRRNIALTTEI